MAFVAARTGTDTMSDMNITPLVDVMLVLLVIFMATALLMDLRLGVNLPQSASPPRPPPGRHPGHRPADLRRQRINRCGPPG